MLYKVKQKLNFFVPEIDMNPLIAFLKRKKKDNDPKCILQCIFWVNFAIHYRNSRFIKV